MNKPKFSKELLFIIGNIFDALAGALLIKADLGNTPMGAFPLVLQELFPFLTIGTMNFIVQVLVLLAVMAIIHHFSFVYLFSFGSAVIYDVFLDIFVFITEDIPVNGTLRIFYFILGIIFVAFGCGAYLYTGLPLMPFDTAVKELSSTFKKDNGSTKLIVDCFFLVSTLTVSLIFFGEILFINVGTIVVSFTNGLFITIFDETLFNHFDYVMSTSFGKYLENMHSFS